MAGFAPPAPAWASRLNEIRAYLATDDRSRRESWPASREIFYVLDAPQTLSAGQAIVHLLHRDRLKQGGWGRFESGEIALADLNDIPDRHDREILAVLRVTLYTDGFNDESFRHYRLGLSAQLLFQSYSLGVDLVKHLLPKMCETGRLLLKTGEGDAFAPSPILWDGGEPWEFHLELAGSQAVGGCRLAGLLRRGEQVIPLAEPDLLLSGGLFFAGGRLSRYEEFNSFAWINSLRRKKEIELSKQEMAKLLEGILAFPRLPPLEIDGSLNIRTLEADPLILLKISTADPSRYSRAGGGLLGELSFEYADHTVDTGDPSSGLYIEEENLLVLRRKDKEKAALDRLRELGFRRVHDYRSGKKVFKLAARRLPAVVEELLKEGWHVEAEGKLYRRAGLFNIQVTSGIDWFEVRGALRFGDIEVPLPELLKALRRGQNTVRLGDGSFGILPEQWLKQQGLILSLGEVKEDLLRFRTCQAALIDLLLQAQPQAGCDELFHTFREKLNGFAGIQALDPPRDFVGALRGYQKEGLGWFRFLDEFGFGGCLADDMGLGKTVQILALLASRRGASEGEGIQPDLPAPSLVVVPKSLVFNWKGEAARFTPGLKVMDYTGPGRPKDTEAFKAYDMILTTYGTLRNDIALLKDFRFDYMILDEAQTVKNANSASAKAARLLQGRRRMALSGTPIENHLGELWSLFEFLNPGMLGGVSFFRRFFKTEGSLDENTRMMLARLLRPFILRRTKERVAPELPDKVEQTIFCELLPSERKRYDELRDYYRHSLQSWIESVGLGKAKIHILEALLRLRQAACHLGLLDKKSGSRSGSKIDMLLQHLEDVLAEERKALVFSQFTSLLAIVRQRLDRLRIPYEYLDGRTRDRAQRVERFQQDPECRLFLISLKAGGLGLNLTAAEYVFLLDPWWNPAVETQAIDRTHRIGQQKKVFAYRLIAKDTVEEKVLELQRSKREIAEAIITEDNRLIGELSQEDLALLLS